MVGTVFNFKNLNLRHLKFNYYKTVSLVKQTTPFIIFKHRKSYFCFTRLINDHRVPHSQFTIYVFLGQSVMRKAVGEWMSNYFRWNE